MCQTCSENVGCYVCANGEIVDMTTPNLQCFGVNAQWSVVYFFAAHIRNISVQPVSSNFSTCEYYRRTECNGCVETNLSHCETCSRDKYNNCIGEDGECWWFDRAGDEREEPEYGTYCPTCKKAMEASTSSEQEE